MNAIPIIIGSLCVIAVAHHYYSTFIAANGLARDKPGHGDFLA